MSIVFLDERLSIFANNSDGTGTISTTPQLIGDIGLQTGTAVTTGNVSDARVSLVGTVVVAGVGEEVIATITLTIERNGTSTAGAGTVIYQEVVHIFSSPASFPISVTAGDFPPAADVVAGQIRYTLFISATTTEGDIVLTGPVAFNGSASAGTTT